MLKDILAQALGYALGYAIVWIAGAIIDKIRKSPDKQ